MPILTPLAEAFLPARAAPVILIALLAATNEAASSFVAERMKHVMTQTRMPALTRLAFAEAKHFPEFADLYLTPDG